MRARVKLLIVLAVAVAACDVALGGGRAVGPEYDGESIDCDVPMSLRIKNTGGSDGAGLCVFASLQMSANYQNVKELLDIFEWMKSQPGGGYPEKVARIMKERAPGVKYKQYEGDSLDFIQEGINSGRPVCVTYGTGELYNMQTIAHMTLCVGLNEKEAAILDNNDPEHIWLMPRDEFLKRFKHPNTSGWAFYLLNPPPPPAPKLPD